MAIHGHVAERGGNDRIIKIAGKSMRISANDYELLQAAKEKFLSEHPEHYSLLKINDTFIFVEVMKNFIENFSEKIKRN